MKTNKYSFLRLQHILIAVALVFCFAQSDSFAQSGTDTAFFYNVDSDPYAAWNWYGTGHIYIIDANYTVTYDSYNWYCYWSTAQWIQPDGNRVFLYVGGHDSYSYQPYTAASRNRWPNATAGDLVGDWFSFPAFNYPPGQRFKVKIDAANLSPDVVNRFEIWVRDGTTTTSWRHWGPLISEPNMTSTELTTYESDVVLLGADAPATLKMAIRMWGGEGSWDAIFDNMTVEFIYSNDIYAGAFTADGRGSGSITDEGTTAVWPGESQSYTITPDYCSEIYLVVIDNMYYDWGFMDDPTAPYTFTFDNVNEEHSIQAVFAKRAFTYEDYVNIPAVAQIIPSVIPYADGTIDCGSTQHCQFEIAEGYEFDRVIVDGEVFTLPITGYTFHDYGQGHRIELYVRPQQFTVRAIVDGTGGTVSPATTTVNYGATHNITITPDPGYRISSIRVDNKPVVGFVGNTYTFENITAGHTLRVVFRPADDYVLTAQAKEGGEVVSTEANQGAWTLLAVPDPCYEFKNWTNLAGNEISTEDTMLVSLKSDSIVYANFTPVTGQFDIAVQSNNATLGTVSYTTGTNLACGTVVAIKATPTEGNVFLNWTDENDNILYFEDPNTHTETPYMPEADLTVTRDMVVTAHFSSTTTLTLATNPPDLGVTPVGGNTYLPFETVSYSVDAVPGYRFLNWTDADADSVVSTARADNEIMMTKNYSLVANYVKVQTLVIKSNPDGAARLSGLGVYVDSTYAFFSATPAREYVFTNWTREEVDINLSGDTINRREVVVSTNLQDSIFMDTNYTLTANFGWATPADPVISSVAASNITNSTAVLNGNIEDIGMPAGTAKGFVYSTDAGCPAGTTTVEVLIPGKIEVAPYKTTIMALTPNTQYYFKAFVVAYGGTYVYGEELSFATNDIEPVEPVITTTAATNITTTTATLNGNLYNIGYPPATAVGFVYSTSANFATSNQITVNNTSISEGDFTSNVSGLIANTTYYVKAWANVDDTRYEGETVSFTTPTGFSLGELNPLMVVNITVAEPRTAAFSATLLSDGGTTEDAELGFVYSTTPNPVVDSAATKLTVDEVKLGAFVDTAFNLECETTYYVRGFYTNEIGTVYTTEVNFTTKCVGIEDVINSTTVKLYPNPTNESTTLSFNLLQGCNVKVTLCDLSGSEMMTIFDGFATGSFVKNIRTSDIVAGTYFVKIQIGKDSIIEKLIVK